MQRVQVFLDVVFLEQFVRVVLFFSPGAEGSETYERKKVEWVVGGWWGKGKGAYDDVRFDKVRYGVEDAFCAAGLLLAPERETL